MTYLKFLEKRFAELSEGDKRLCICISGLSGSGKNTAAELLQAELKKHGLDLQIYNSGDFFRKVAKEMGHDEANLNKFSEKVKNDSKLSDEVNKQIDMMTLEQAFKTGGIFVGRLTFAVLGDESSMNIFLITDKKLLAQRITHDKSRAEYSVPVDEIVKRITERDDADKQAYKDLYEIDYDDLTGKCILLENSETKDDLREDLVDIVLPKLKEDGFLEE
jgi:cytidylate kinase